MEQIPIRLPLILYSKIILLTTLYLVSVWCIFNNSMHINNDNQFNLIIPSQKSRGFLFNKQFSCCITSSTVEVSCIYLFTVSVAVVDFVVFAVIYTFVLPRRYVNHSMNAVPLFDMCPRIITYDQKNRLWSTYRKRRPVEMWIEIKQCKETDK